MREKLQKAIEQVFREADEDRRANLNCDLVKYQDSSVDIGENNRGAEQYEEFTMHAGVFRARLSDVLFETSRHDFQDGYLKD